MAGICLGVFAIVPVLVFSALVFSFNRHTAQPDLAAVAKSSQVNTMDAKAVAATAGIMARITGGASWPAPAASAIVDECDSSAPASFGSAWGPVICSRTTTEYLGFNGDFTQRTTDWDAALTTAGWNPTQGLQRTLAYYQEFEGKPQPQTPGSVGRSRDQFTVSTKVGRLLVPEPGGSARPDPQGFAVPAAYRRVWDFSASGVRASLKASLDRLGLDRIDTVLIHDPGDADADADADQTHQALASAAPELARLRAQGVIDSFGADTKDVAFLARFARETSADTAMIAGRYTLLDQSALDDLLPACLDRGVPVLNAAIFNSGILAQAGPVDNTRFEYSSAPRAIPETAAAIATRCTDHGTTLPAAAVAFSGAHPAVTSLVVGADDAQQIRATSALRTAPPSAALERPGRRSPASSRRTRAHAHVGISAAPSRPVWRQVGRGM